jgi:glycosyltransferase involved in cell wall biosynthesis/O-antigen/teichoic acid export membrane protein
MVMGPHAVIDRAVAPGTDWARAPRGAGTAWAPLSLRKNFSWTLVGNVIYVGCQFLMLSVLARIGGPTMVGLFALGLALTEPIILFANLSLRSVLATDAKDLFSFADYLGLRLTTTTLALLVIAAVAFVSDYRGEALAVIVAIGVAKAFDAVSDVCYGLLQQQERMDRIAKSMMLKGPLGLVAFASAVALTGGLLWGVVALAAVRAVTMLTFDLGNVITTLRRTRTTHEATEHGRRNALKAARPRWDRRTLTALVRLSLPLGMVILLVSLATNIPRYFLAQSAGPAALGIYATMVYFVMAGDTLAKALGQASVPRLAAYHAAGNVNAFRRLLSRLLIVALVVGLGGIVGAAVAGAPMLRLLFGNEFAQHADVLILVMTIGAITFVGDYLGVAITAMRRFSAQVWVHLVEVMVLIAASAVLVRNGGLVGAAWATLLGALIVTAGFGFLLLTGLRTPLQSTARDLSAPPAAIPDSAATTLPLGPMRITFLTRSLGYGGAERQLSALARGLHARGHRVVVAVFYAGGPLEGELRRAGVPVQVFGKAGRWDLPLFFLRLIQFLRQEQPQILHGYLDTQNLISMAARLIIPTKAVAGVRASDPDLRHRDWLAHLLYFAEQRLIPFSDLVVVNSRAGLDYFGPRRLRRNRTVVIPNGIDADRFVPDREAGRRVRHELGVSEQTTLIGVVARLDPMKDHTTFLRGAAGLAQRREDVRFVCVGSGPSRYVHDLRARAEELGLGQRLIWAGSRDDMPAVYNALDVAVISSHGAEGFPNVVGEAMACGVPCVVTDVGDAAWIVGETGRVVPPRDPAALAAAIDSMLDDAARGLVNRQLMRDRIVANFSIAALVDSSEWVFRRLLTDGDTL